MNKVDFYSFDATNDQELINSNTIALIPKNALKPHTMYRVSITMNITYVNDEQERGSKGVAVYHRGRRV